MPGAPSKAAGGAPSKAAPNKGLAMQAAHLGGLAGVPLAMPGVSQPAEVPKPPAPESAPAKRPASPAGAARAGLGEGVMGTARVTVLLCSAER
jgi:hypothetical protein